MPPLRAPQQLLQLHCNRMQDNSMRSTPLKATATSIQPTSTIPQQNSNIPFTTPTITSIKQQGNDTRNMGTPTPSIQIQPSSMLPYNGSSFSITPSSTTSRMNTTTTNVAVTTSTTTTFTSTVSTSPPTTTVDCPTGSVVSPCPLHLRECVPANYICNGEVECEEGEDEIGCFFGPPATIRCLFNEVACRNADDECIQTRLYCDGREDCTDGSDESFCPAGEVPRSVCPRGMIPSPCINDTTCFPAGRICNSMNDCPNVGESSRDERFCSGRSACLPGFTPCRRDVSQCVLNQAVCNGIRDCFDSSDEEFCIPDACSPGFVATPCSQDFPNCISTSSICDGQVQCSGGEDELLCSGQSNNCPFQSIPCRTSPPGQRCVQALLVCNGVQGDCNDFTDEFFCGSFSCPDGFQASPCPRTVELCIEESKICNLVSDCVDMADEGEECDHAVEFVGFGEVLRDLVVQGDDIFTRVHVLSSPIMYFNMPETVVQASTNGIISFRSPLPNDHTPMDLPRTDPPLNIPFIAPFWVDLNFMDEGRLYAGELEGERLLEDFGGIRDVFPEFLPSVGVIATWFHPNFFVQPSNDEEIVAFQAVVVSNGIVSFAIFKYANPDAVLHTVNSVVGFDSGDGVRATTVFGLETRRNEDFLMEENVYRIDGDCVTLFDPLKSCGLEAYASVCNPLTFEATSCNCRSNTTGYDHATRSCVDINECITSMPCAENAACVDMEGGFNCICNKTGFQGDGFSSCEDIDECEMGCNCSQTCTNTIGSFECSCDEGYTLNEDGLRCDDIDECLFDPFPCDDRARCVNVPGSFTCACISLYMGDGTSCAVSTVALSTGIVLGILLIAFIGGVAAVTIVIVKYRRKLKSVTLRHETTTNLEMLARRDPDAAGNEYFRNLRDHTVRSSLIGGLPKSLVVNSCNLQIGMTIGQGEFGIVYKGLLKKGFSEGFSESVAVKTLKGFMQDELVKDLLKECVKMQEFDHPNVLQLLGVCLDGGPAPYIIMPFMANGSLLSYLKEQRENLVLEPSNSDDMQEVQKKLTDMCIQVAKGMEYLAGQRIIHRDLAARNCMIDISFVIKVADFGLAESIDSSKDYFRQDQEATIKLPIKWLAPESISDGIFSEKTDVWAYGVTCWEVFSGGKTPYPGIHPLELSRQLEIGYRMDKPFNAACPEEMYQLMKSCWSGKANQRPTFSELLTRLTSLLESMADYLDFFTVSNPYSTMEEEPEASQRETPAPTAAPQGIPSTPTTPLPQQDIPSVPSRPTALPPLDVSSTGHGRRHSSITSPLDITPHSSSMSPLAVYGTPPHQGRIIQFAGSNSSPLPSIAATPGGSDDVIPLIPASPSQSSVVPSPQDLSSSPLPQTAMSLPQGKVASLASPRKGSLCLPPQTEPPKKLVTSRASYPTLPELPNRNTI